MILIESQFVTEAKKEDDAGAKSWKIQGVFMQAEAQNKNNRIYPSKVLSRETNRYVNEFVKTNRAVGELSHPQSSTINPDRAAILIESIDQTGNDYIGKAKVLNTPCGKIIQALLEGGVQIGVSSRGQGSVKKLNNGISEVQDDYNLICIDAVMSPSAPKAFVEGLYESTEIENILSDSMMLEEFYQWLTEKRASKMISNSKEREQKLIASFQKALQQIKS
jgi:hypothetical protein